MVNTLYIDVDRVVKSRWTLLPQMQQRTLAASFALRDPLLRGELLYRPIFLTKFQEGCCPSIEVSLGET